MNLFHRLINKLIVLGSCCLGGFVLAPPSYAAERIVFYDGLLQFELTVADLEAYAQAGQASDSVTFILQRIDPDQTWLRAALTQPYQLSEDPTQNLILIDRWLTSPQGESLLTRFGETIRSASRTNNGFFALRASLLTAAASDRGVTILNVIHQFPGDTLTIDARQAPETFAYLSELGQLGQILQRLQSAPGPSTDDVSAADWWLQQALLSWLQADDKTTVQYLERSLSLRQSISDVQGEAITLYLLGLLHLTQGLPQEGLDYSQRALDIFRSIGFAAGEGLSLVSLGGIHWGQGDFVSAIGFYEQALSTYPDLAVGAMAPITTTDFVVSVFAAGPEGFSPSRLMTLVHAHWGRTYTLSFLGQIYQDLGQTELALSYAQQILQQAEKSAPVNLEAKIEGLKAVGKIYLFSDQPELALTYLEQAYALEQELAGEVIQLLGGVGLDFTFRSVSDLDTRFYLSIVHRKLANADRSLEYGQDYLAELQTTGRGIQQGNDALLAQALYIVGLTYAQLQQYDLAMEHYRQVIRLYQQFGLTVGEAYITRDMGRILVAQGHTELGIVFHKQAVVLIESIRQRNQGLSDELQRSYSDSVSDIYRELADLLLQQDRILEAQQTLDLLKVQELDDYLQNVRGAVGSASTVAYWPAEQNIVDLYQQAIAQGQELAALRRLESQGPLTLEQTHRRDQLVENEGILLENFDRFIDHPDVVTAVDQLTRTARRQNLALEELNALQNNLRDLDQGAVLLYPLVLEDRLELVLVTPYAPPIRRSVPVASHELNSAIVAFRRALTSPNRDATAVAHQLYEWLVAPIEADLAAAGAETLIYAPDAQLRYIPLAALHDGQQWLAQRYRINHITAASLTDLNTQPRQTVSVLAGAFTQGTFQVEVASRELKFQGLPYAGIEVQTLADTLPNTTTLFDGAFNPTVTIPQMNSHSIVHLATHAAFVNGQPEDSFILFGNGERVTLRDMRQWNLSNVELVVLSACQTALGGQLGNGEEILGFGYQIQRTGARASISTLWSVDDGGTQLLMNAFYRQFQAGASKAEALRQAQIELLSVETVHDSVHGSRDLTHPYYWAPFILIGNGL